ncbi:hypothetical protein SAMD00023353_0502920 [Rosellinia necatrix]|uniref:Uncharacterized protein n=1 Tax=Rosellinia necatrix TaxID=77044 RepID=A0A1S8A5L6_ROSNE|nr:hypothetical protein SAMD00023353_0502920 [Rosellinia necatrix]
MFAVCILYRREVVRRMTVYGPSLLPNITLAVDIDIDVDVDVDAGISPTT